MKIDELFNQNIKIETVGDLIRELKVFDQNTKIVFLDEAPKKITILYQGFDHIWIGGEYDKDLIKLVSNKINEMVK